MVAMRNTLPWPGLLATAVSAVAELETPAEQQESTLGEALISGFMDLFETLKCL
jgi:hypothetical protein